MAKEFEGALLAVIAERAGVAASVLERLGGATGDVARQRLSELRALPAGQRAKEVATVLARVASPMPLTLRAVHPEWVAAALEAEPEAKAAAKTATDAATVATSEAAELSPGAVWMLRRAFGGFPLTAPAAEEVAQVRERLARRGAQALVAVLGGVGGAGGKRAAVAAALVQLGESGEALKAAVRESEATGESTGEGAPASSGGVDVGALGAATRACRGVDLRSAHALERIGVAAMAKELAVTRGEERERWRELCWFVPRAVGMAMAMHLG